MARRTIRVTEVVELLQRWHAGRRMGELCSSLGMDPKTVRKYTAPAREAGISPGSPALPPQEWAVLVEGWFPGLVDGSIRQRTWPAIEVHRERIAGWLGQVTISTIHQRLRDDHGLEASESSLRHYIWANCDEDVARDVVVVRRDTRRRATRLKSSTGCWAAGGTRRRIGCGGCGAFSWCWPTPG